MEPDIYNFLHLASFTLHDMLNTRPRFSIYQYSVPFTGDQHSLVQRPRVAEPSASGHLAWLFPLPAVTTHAQVWLVLHMFSFLFAKERLCLL